MSDRPFLSHFSPQWTDPEYLEAILVQREELLAESVALVRESVLTQNKHHLLFVGSRGAGKTHLVTLIHHRLQQDKALTDRMRFAWLNEDETATSFLRLLVQIYRSLSERYPVEFPPTTLSSLSGQDPSTAQEKLSQALLSHLQGRTLVCLMENLDSLFRDLSEAEQRTWRAFIQNHPVFATVGTAQALFDGVSSRNQPFFGFFDTRHLEPLTIDEARTLLENIARIKERTDLLEYLQTPAGHARVSAIRALAGGNPRLYLIFSDLLVNAQALDDLVRPFEEIVDRQLTSYYQERLRWLSPQQREIVQFLCRARSPIAVKYIADGLFTTHNSITGQLKQLRQMHYVESHPQGREVLYELAEPLMRLALQVKETHDHKPLALIVDFLRIWHERREIEAHLAQTSPNSPSYAYFAAARTLMESGPNLRHELLRQNLETLPEGQCDDNTLTLARHLAEESNLPADWLKLAIILINRKELEEAIRICTEIIDSENITPTDLATALIRRGYANYFAGQSDGEIMDYTRAVELQNTPLKQLTMALFNRGIAYYELGYTEKAIADYTNIIDLPNAPIDHIAKALNNRGALFDKRDQAGYILRDLKRLFTLPDYQCVVDVVKPRLHHKARVMVLAIFSHTTDPKRWEEQLTIFVGHFARFEGLSQLGDALVRHLPEVARSPLNHAAWDAWADAWETARGTLAAGEQDRLEIPLRLLRTGIAYLKTNDEGRLLALPREERRVLREALGLPQEKGN